MNLKNFHIFFIVIATLFCLGFGSWCTGDTYPAAKGFEPLGYLSFAGALALVVYGAVYFKKLHLLNKAAS
ncbi:MAG: hypothetical protein O2923_04960 [Verrucomicrobia bacterium]|nr:hypothetical protein [Verrucomicrobiota bacterium]MDA1086785.1 hypothetical protein [Verrucomicrobiota bacterium]